MPPDEQAITSCPDIKVEKITNETEFLIIGCDGIWDCLTSQQAVDKVKNSLAKQKVKPDKDFKLSKMLEGILDSILAPEIGAVGGCGCDNMTIEVVVFSPVS